MTETRFVSPDFSSAEAQRQWYLRQLGVHSYFPRFVLPGALPSQACALPLAEPAAAAPAFAPEATAEVRSPASAPTGDPQGSAASARRALFEDDVEPPKPTAAPAQRRPQVEGRAAGDATEAPRFRMLLLRAERGLAICNQVPLQGPEALGAQEQRLLQNMLAWLGTGLAPGRPRAFPWPPQGLGAEGSDAEELAGRSLYGFLEQAQQEQGFTRLLLMGSTAPELLQHWQEGADRAWPWQAFRTHSLGEMLAQPLLKREAWQALQPLHQLLRAG